MEKLYELHDAGDFDLIVVDTPPTRHALDFLDAPRRLTRFLDNRIFRMLMVPTRIGAPRRQRSRRSAFLRTIARVVGRDVDRRRRRRSSARSKAWSRASATARRRSRALLNADETAFVLVTTPRRDAVEEAQYFAERLLETGRSVEALVVNRMHPHFSDESPDEIRRRARPGSRPRRPDARGAASPISSTSKRSRHGSGVSSPGSRSASATRRSRTCPSCATTCSTSPLSTRSAVT